MYKRQRQGLSGPPQFAYAAASLPSGLSARLVSPSTANGLCARQPPPVANMLQVLNARNQPESHKAIPPGRQPPTIAAIIAHRIKPSTTTTHTPNRMPNRIKRLDNLQRFSRVTFHKSLSYLVAQKHGGFGLLISADRSLGAWRRAHGRFDHSPRCDQQSMFNPFQTGKSYKTDGAIHR